MKLKIILIMINNIIMSEFKIYSLIAITLAGIVRCFLKYGITFSGLKLISFDMINEEIGGLWLRNS